MLRTICSVRVGERVAELRQAVGKPEGKADAAADGKADAGAPEADPDVAQQARPTAAASSRQRDIGRRRQHPRRHQPVTQATCQTSDDGQRHDPLNKAVGSGSRRLSHARQACDQAHDCDALTSGRCSLAMVSPNGPVLTRSGVAWSVGRQRQQREHQFGEAVGFLQMRIAGQDEGVDAEVLIFLACAPRPFRGSPTSAVPAPPRTRPTPAQRLGLISSLSRRPPCSAAMRCWPTEVHAREDLLRRGDGLVVDDG